MKKKTIVQRKILLSAFVGLCSLSANAGSPYIGAQLGQAHGYGNLVKWSLNDEFDKGYTGRVSVGYLWNTWKCVSLGLETGFQFYETLNETPYAYIYPTGDSYLTEINSSRWTADIMGVVDWKVFKRFDIFAKLGAGLVRYKYDISIIDPSLPLGFENVYLTFNNNRIEPGYLVVPKAAIGIGFDVTDKVNLNLSAYQEARSDSHSIPGTRSYMMGLTYTFC